MAPCPERVESSPCRSAAGGMLSSRVVPRDPEDFQPRPQQGARGGRFCVAATNWALPTWQRAPQPRTLRLSLQVLASPPVDELRPLSSPGSKPGKECRIMAHHREQGLSSPEITRRYLA